MWRFVVARRWWIGHLLVVTCCAVFIRLGRWQWDRSQSPTGDWQNLGYALQWPLFAVMLMVAWGRFLWLECHRAPETDCPDSATVRNNHPPRQVAPVSPRPAYPQIREDDPDDELTAYNAYLARLAEQDQR